MSYQALMTAENLLASGNFVDSRSLALEVKHSDPSLAILACEIIAIAEVMTAATYHCFGDGRLDWYAILGVPRYSHDPQLVRQRFKDLITLINPNKNNKNNFPFAKSSFELVRDAYNVLSDPTKKVAFDNERKIFESNGKNYERAADDTFWTVCPYCYYVYEYHSLFKDCCLKCRNGNCMRGFYGVPVQSPPADVANSGQYLCLGFSPVEFDGQNENRASVWSPFTPQVIPEPEIRYYTNNTGYGAWPEPEIRYTNVGKQYANTGYVAPEAEIRYTNVGKSPVEEKVNGKRPVVEEKVKGKRASAAEKGKGKKVVEEEEVNSGKKPRKRKESILGDWTYEMDMMKGFTFKKKEKKGKS